MFIKLNYSLSIILHIFVACCLIFVFKIEKQANIYNDVININLKNLKTFKTEDISREKNFIDIKKDKEIKKEINKNIESITEIKTPTKEIKKIDKNKNIYKFEEQKKEKKNNENKDNVEKKQKNTVSKITSQQQNTKKKPNKTTSAVVTNEDKEIFNNYNNELKSLIKKKAYENYPRISLRKREEGIVELKFSIDINGNILNINIGKKTTASRRLINASINTLELISPYKKNPILKKNNTFSIIIVYKLQ